LTNRLELHDLFAAIGIAVGLAGILLVVTPGLVIEVGAIALWAMVEGSIGGWFVLALSVGIAVSTTILKYQRPGRRLQDSGVPKTHLFLGVVVGIVGFFVIPVVGAPIGFVLTIYVLALIQVGRVQAWPATKAAMRAIVHSTGIELAGGSLIALIWIAAALAL